MRRLRTRGLPGQPGTEGRTYSWDFRRPDGAWVPQISMWSAGSSRARPQHPEQVAWLVAQGFPEPDSHGRLDLTPEALERLLELVGPAAEIPWRAFELLAQVTALVDAERFAEALPLTAQLVALTPTWDEARRARVGLLLFHLQDAEATQAELASIPEGVLDAAELRLRRQALATLVDDWSTYADIQEESIAAGNRRVGDFEVLGLARWAAGQMERSVQAFVDGLTAYPGERSLADRQAEVLGAMGRVDDAVALLDRLIQEDPAPAKSWALRGWVRRHTDPEAAAADYAQALARDPEQPVARVGRGLQYLDAGDRVGARADLAPFVHSSWQEAVDAWQRFVDTAAEGEDVATPPNPWHTHDHDHER
ncbi:MAG: tetratricopeptide repeat protein [Alphaproteobacteria bacterium]|nr:tetratricopeptide repeat protein [Alphaproteobacteria bacterium]